ncbi:MAG TPA: DUF4395 domain-containing protein [Amnibacterium sp.]|jgi:hypothetical protein|nr:DUF4395 domain-containing protein [Amnibacterium sp.]
MSAPVAARPTTVDPRAPRFGAAITAVLLLVDVFLGVAGSTLASVLLLAAVTALFAWGAFAGIRRHPYGLLFRRFVRPRLAPPGDLEDAAAPTFAQLIGFVVTVAGLAVALAGVPLAAPIAAGVAFLAAFLNAVFDFCLGCELYLLLVRAGVLGRRR